MPPGLSYQKDIPEAWGFKIGIQHAHVWKHKLSFQIVSKLFLLGPWLQSCIGFEWSVPTLFSPPSSQLFSVGYSVGHKSISGTHRWCYSRGIHIHPLSLASLDKKKISKQYKSVKAMAYIHYVLFADELALINSQPCEQETAIIPILQKQKLRLICNTSKVRLVTCPRSHG